MEDSCKWRKEDMLQSPWKARDLSVKEIKEVLMKKIKEELNVPLSDSKKTEKINYKVNKINTVSLFSGAGGLDLGVELAGISITKGEKESGKSFQCKDTYMINKSEGPINVIYTNDTFKEANETYSLNLGGDAVQDNTNIKKVPTFPKADLVLGGFPCPGFSAAGPRLIDDDRNFLYIHFVRAIIEAEPLAFVAENVKGILTLGKGEVLKQILEDFKAAGYNLKYKLVNSRDFGVPQLRERVFIIGIREDLNIKYEFPEPTHGSSNNPYLTLRDAIGDLVEDPGEYYEDSYSSIYMSRNRKKTWEDQSYTIQASGRQAPQHPGGLPMRKVGKDQWEFQGEENRRLSVKEVARIQTFPDWFIFSKGDSKNIKLNNQLNKQYKQIGNAVPVKLAKEIVQPLLFEVMKYKKMI